MLMNRDLGSFLYLSCLKMLHSFPTSRSLEAVALDLRLRMPSYSSQKPEILLVEAVFTNLYM